MVRDGEVTPPLPAWCSAEPDLVHIGKVVAVPKRGVDIHAPRRGRHGRALGNGHPLPAPHPTELGARDPDEPTAAKRLGFDLDEARGPHVAVAVDLDGRELVGDGRRDPDSDLLARARARKPGRRDVAVERLLRPVRRDVAGARPRTPVELHRNKKRRWRTDDRATAHGEDVTATAATATAVIKVNTGIVVGGIPCVRCVAGPFAVVLPAQHRAEPILFTSHTDPDPCVVRRKRLALAIDSHAAAILFTRKIAQVH